MCKYFFQKMHSNNAMELLLHPTEDRRSVVSGRLFHSLQDTNG